MKYTCLSFTKENDALIDLFVSLPKKLYSIQELTQDIETEKKILKGNHTISNDIKIKPFVVINLKNEIIARCIVTFYDNDDSAYIGFFECYNDLDACKLLFEKITNYAIINGKEKLIGPYDCSFWIKYRFKSSKFGIPYTGEPYNKDYYVELWEKCGFEISDKYVSNFLRVPRKEDSNEKYKKRLEKFLKNGYTFISPSKENYDEKLKEIYWLLTKLYSSFPGYKHITEKQFIEMFTSLKYILNFSMVKLVYKNNNLVAFFIGIPNYKNLVYGKITFLKLMKILKTKIKPKEYVLLYMGVDPKHLGLGSAFAEISKDMFLKNKTKSIGALIHEGKVTNNYYNNLIVDSSEYVLLSKKIKSNHK